MAIYTLQTSTGPSLDWGARGVPRVVQNVRNLCQIYRYEIAYDRTLGIDPAIIDRPLDEASALFAAMVADLIERKEPRAKVLQVDYHGATLGGQLDFEVVLDIV